MEWFNHLDEDESSDGYEVIKKNESNFIVKKSDGTEYHLTKKQSNWVCDCPGFRYRRKCFAPGTLVHTQYGLTAIEKIQPGDLVYTKEGTLRRVNYNDKLFSEDMVRVQVHGEGIYCTSEHEFFVVKNGKLKKIEAGNLKKGDRVVFPKFRHEEDVKFDKKRAFLIGLYAGDGHIDVVPIKKLGTKRSENRVEISDREALYSVNIALDWKYRELYESRLDGFEVGSEGKTLVSRNLGLVEDCYRYAGLTNKKRGLSKTFSEDILKWDRESKRALVAGFFTADGTISSNGKNNNGRVLIYNTNGQMMVVIFQILSEDYRVRFGYYDREEYKVGGAKPQRMYYVSLSGYQAADFVKEYPVWLDCKGSNYYSFSDSCKPKVITINGVDYTTDIIQGVEIAPPSEVYSLEVEESHSYLLKYCAVSNCKHLDLIRDQLPVRHPRAEVTEAIKDILPKLKTLTPRVEVVGSYRRGKKDSKDIDIIMDCSSATFKKVLPILQSYDNYKHVMAGDTIIRGFCNGIEMDINRLTENMNYFLALEYRTGPQEHNIAMRALAKKLHGSLSENELVVNGRNIRVTSEKDIYDALGVVYQDPQHRSKELKFISRKDVGAYRAYDGDKDLGASPSRAYAKGQIKQVRQMCKVVPAAIDKVNDWSGRKVDIRFTVHEEEEKNVLGGYQIKNPAGDVVPCNQYKLSIRPIVKIDGTVQNLTQQVLVGSRSVSMLEVCYEAFNKVFKHNMAYRKVTCEPKLEINWQSKPITFTFVTVKFPVESVK